MVSRSRTEAELRPHAQIEMAQKHRNTDGLAGDVDYSAHGIGYAQQRRTDPRIAAVVHEALGLARVVLNVGAGAGSYEPLDRHVIAIEPAADMRAQRPAHLTPAIAAVAEKLPLDDQSVDASMAMITVHQWRDLQRGLSEMRRVTRGPIVILTFDADELHRFWLAEYAPELVAVERRRFPPLQAIAEDLGGTVEIRTIRIPIDCVDGFSEAFYARPEKFLDPAVRRSQSAWSFVSENEQQRIVERLASDLRSGAWDEKFGEWRKRPYFEGSLRLIVRRSVRF
jgi:SAM-dependent methyltransferase